MVCDEIHNVYNSVKKNNWGIAIQYIIDNIPSLKCIYMSATPINNNPSEIVDVLKENYQMIETVVVDAVKNGSFLITQIQLLVNATGL